MSIFLQSITIPIRCSENTGLHDQIKLGNGAHHGCILKIYSEHLYSKSPGKSCHKQHHFTLLNVFLKAF